MKSIYSSKKNKFSGKIVSLLASTTEILCALGLEDNIVGISHECDNPLEILDRPRISKPNINIHSSSKEINLSVEKSIFDGLSIYNLDFDKLNSLKPDYIFTQDMCKVCAVSSNDLNVFFNDTIENPIQLISYSPINLSEILHQIKNIGLMLGLEEGANALVTDFKIRLKTFLEVKNKKKYYPKIAFIEWIEPIYFGGNWIPELIHYAGGRSIFGKVGQHSEIIDFDLIVENDPDFILICPCGFDIKQTLSELKPFLRRPEWSFLKAVRNNNVYILDGNKFFNRPGTSIITSIEIIAEIIHPEKFIYEFENIAWIKYKNTESNE